MAEGISRRSVLVSILSRRRWAWQGTLWGFRADLGAPGGDGAQLQGAWTELGLRSFQNITGSIRAAASSRRCLGIPCWWGTLGAVPAAWLTPSWLSMLGFELSLPRCGGVWAAQCLNSLMTFLGHCPCPARPRDVPGRKPWGWSCGAAANLSRARGQRGIASPWDINGVLQKGGMTAGQG